MANLNRVQLMGNVGKEPDAKFTSGGKKVVAFSLAVNSSYTNKNGEKVQDTEWINLEAWGKLGDIVQEYVNKGSSLYVEGRLKTDTFEDKNGEKRYYTKVVVSSLQFLGGQKSTTSKASESVAPAEVPDDDEIPF